MIVRVFYGLVGGSGFVIGIFALVTVISRAHSRPEFPKAPPTGRPVSGRPGDGDSSGQPVEQSGENAESEASEVEPGNEPGEGSQEVDRAKGTASDNRIDQDAGHTPSRENNQADPAERQHGKPESDDPILSVAAVAEPQQSPKEIQINLSDGSTRHASTLHEVVQILATADPRWVRRSNRFHALSSWLTLIGQSALAESIRVIEDENASDSRERLQKILGDHLTATGLDPGTEGNVAGPT